MRRTHHRRFTLAALSALAALHHHPAAAEPVCEGLDSSEIWQRTDKYGANADGSNASVTAKQERMRQHVELGARYANVAALWVHDTRQAATNRRNRTLATGKVRDMLSTATLVDVAASFPGAGLDALQGRVLLTALHAIDSRLPTTRYEIAPRNGELLIHVGDERSPEATTYLTKVGAHFAGTTSRPSLGRSEQTGWYDAVQFLPVDDASVPADERADIAVVILDRAVDQPGAVLAGTETVPDGTALRVVGYGRGISGGMFELPLPEPLAKLQASLGGYGAAYGNEAYRSAASRCDKAHQETGWGVRKAFDVVIDASHWSCVTAAHEAGAVACITPAARDFGEPDTVPPWQVTPPNTTQLAIAMPTQSDSGGPLFAGDKLYAIISQAGMATRIGPNRHKIESVLKAYVRAK